MTSKLAVRLSEPDKAVVATILQHMTVPNREPPTVSEAIRVALHQQAEQLGRRDDR